MGTLSVDTPLPESMKALGRTKVLSSKAMSDGDVIADADRIHRVHYTAPEAVTSNTC